MDAWWDDEGFWIQKDGELFGPFDSEEQGVESIVEVVGGS